MYEREKTQREEAVQILLLHFSILFAVVLQCCWKKAQCLTEPNISFMMQKKEETVTMKLSHKGEGRNDY